MTPPSESDPSAHLPPRAAGSGGDADAAALSTQWADPDLAAIETLIRDSALRGWRDALAEVEPSHPFFATRMRNLSLGNWHLLLGRPADGVALDVGCGFGSLALGLGHHFRTVLGVDALPSRLAWAALRARQDDYSANVFARASAFALPVRDRTVTLATMNGVLEWAGLYAEGKPRELQLAILREVRRTLTPTGNVAVAIENRFAMETLAGLRDTHTNLRLVPALPRRLADLVSRFRRRAPYRTYLYDQRGYRALMHDAGYRQVALYQLIANYNDYDFVADPRDAATYAFLWRRGAVRSFHSRARRARTMLSRVAPRLLGSVGYAYLVLAGEDAATPLDASHPIWRRAAEDGVSPGRGRFACQGPGPGTLTIVTHDGNAATAAITLRAPRAECGGALGGIAGSFFERQPVQTASWMYGDVEIGCWRP